MEEEVKTKMREVEIGHSLGGEVKEETRGQGERKEKPVWLLKRKGKVKRVFNGKPTKHIRDQTGRTEETMISEMVGLWSRKSLSHQLGRMVVMRGGETLLVGNREVVMVMTVEIGGVRVGKEKRLVEGGRGGIVL